MLEFFLDLFWQRCSYTVLKLEQKFLLGVQSNNRHTPMHAGIKNFMCSKVFAMKEKFLPFYFL